MGRNNMPRNKQVKVTREVIALAALAAHRAALRGEQDTNYLSGRVYGSRKVTRRMVRALRAQAA